MKKHFRRLAAALLLLVLTLSLAGCGSAEEDSLGERNRYTITAELDPEAMTLRFKETLRMRWERPGETQSLYFHLYGNKFRSSRRAEDASIQILSVSDGKGRALPYTLEQSDQILHVEINRALAQGQELTLSFEGEANIPLMATEYGHGRDGEIQMGMFYPQLAVFDENGWDTDPAQRNGDGRYAEVADFDLTLTAPDAWQILCNGEAISRETENGRSTWRFTASVRREVMFCAYHNYRVREREADGVLLRGAFSARIPDEVAAVVMDDAEAALRYFSDKLYPYPYETLTVTNAALAMNAGYSKEYAGLFTVYLGEQIDYDAHLFTMHEAAHQWFYALVGSDENREPWLDEAFATFFSYLCMEKMYPEEEPWWGFLRLVSEMHEGEKVNVPADAVSDYSFTIYYRGAWFLHLLMEELGEEKFLRRVSEYCSELAFQNASTQDFLRIVVREDPKLLEIAREYLDF